MDSAPSPSVRYIAKLAGHTAKASRLAWAPDGRMLATASDDGTCRFWGTDGIQMSCLSGHTGPVTDVSWAPDGRRVATSGGDGTVRVWDAASGAIQFVLSGEPGGESSVAWSPDGHRIASGGLRGTIRIWDAATGNLRNLFPAHDTGADHSTATTLAEAMAMLTTVNSIAWRFDGKCLATAAFDRTIRVWDADNGTEHCRFGGYSDIVISVAWSPDGTRLATGSADRRPERRAQIWDLVTGTGIPLLGHTDAVGTIAWSPDGRRLATGSDDGTTRLWDAGNHTTLAVLDAKPHMLLSAAWAPDNATFATSDTGTVISLWNCPAADASPQSGAVPAATNDQLELANLVLHTFEQVIGKSNAYFDVGALAVSRAGGLGNLADVMAERTRTGADVDLDRPWRWLATVAEQAYELKQSALVVRVGVFTSFWCTQIAPGVTQADWEAWVLTRPSDETAARIATVVLRAVRHSDPDQKLPLANGETITMKTPMLWSAMQLAELSAQGIAVDPAMLAEARRLRSGG